MSEQTHLSLISINIEFFLCLALKRLFVSFSTFYMASHAHV